MYLDIKQGKEILYVGGYHNQIVLIGITPHLRIGRAAQTNVWHRDPIASKRSQTRNQCRRQVLIEKKLHAD